MTMNRPENLPAGVEWDDDLGGPIVRIPDHIAAQAAPAQPQPTNTEDKPDAESAPEHQDTEHTEAEHTEGAPA